MLIRPGPNPDDGVVDGLLCAAGRGDIVAFGAFYDQTAPAVFGLLRGVLGKPTTAEDATERVYLQVWRSAAGFDPAHGCARSVLLRAAYGELIHRRPTIVAPTTASDVGGEPAASDRR